MALSPEELVEELRIEHSFLVSFLVDAQGGQLQAQRHPNVRIYVPPQATNGPTRIICRMLKPDRIMSPVPLYDNNGLVCRILELGPSQMCFNTPILFEVPHHAVISGRERELVIFRSDNGDTWKEHALEASDKAVSSSFGTYFDSLKSNADLMADNIVRILTQDLPVYFAIVSRTRQEAVQVGPEGGTISSSVISKVQVHFPSDALKKKIRVSLQTHSISRDLCMATFNSSEVHVSPVVTIEPRRRKFHTPIAVEIPFSPDVPAQSRDRKVWLRLLCSIAGGSDPAVWQDITGGTPLELVGNCVRFTSTVSARFWAIICPQDVDSAELCEKCSQIYNHSIKVPYYATLAVYGRRYNNEKQEGDIRVLCCVDDPVEKTLECQQEYSLIATGPKMEVLHDHQHEVEILRQSHDYDMRILDSWRAIVNSHSMMGHPPHNLDDVGDKYPLYVHAFQENRSVTLPVVGVRGKLVFWNNSIVSSLVPALPTRKPLVTLEIQLPSNAIKSTETINEQDSKDPGFTYNDWRRTVVLEDETIARSELDVMEVANLVGGDWPTLGQALGVPRDVIHEIDASPGYTSHETRAFRMLIVWEKNAKELATGNELVRALSEIGREDVVRTCMRSVAFVTSDEERNQARVNMSRGEDFNDDAGNKSIDESMIVEIGDQQSKVSIGDEDNTQDDLIVQSFNHKGESFGNVDEQETSPEEKEEAYRVLIDTLQSEDVITHDDVHTKSDEGSSVEEVPEESITALTSDTRPSHIVKQDMDDEKVEQLPTTPETREKEAP